MYYSFTLINGPSHEILVLIAYVQKPSKMPKLTDSVVLEVLMFVLYFHTLHMGEAKALLPEPLLLVDVISTKIMCASSNMVVSIYFFWDLLCLLKSNGKLQN